jgi:5-methylcytosine-specific restriction endonuclease McrA
MPRAAESSISLNEMRSWLTSATISGPMSRRYARIGRRIARRMRANAAKTAAWREVNPEHMRAWRAANPEHSRRNHAARKARQLSLPSERVDLRTVWERSGGQCWLCRSAVGTDAVVDHLIPLAADLDELAKWGVGHPGHVTANLELACYACNSRKSKRILPCAIARYLFNTRSKARNKRHQG